MIISDNNRIHGSPNSHSKVTLTIFKLLLILATRLDVATRILDKPGRDSSRLGLRRPGGISDARIIRTRKYIVEERFLRKRITIPDIAPRFGLHASAIKAHRANRRTRARERDYVIINHPCIVYSARPSPIINGPLRPVDIYLLINRLTFRNYAPSRYTRVPGNRLARTSSRVSSINNSYELLLMAAMWRPRYRSRSLANPPFPDTSINFLRSYICRFMCHAIPFDHGKISGVDRRVNRQLYN